MRMPVLAALGAAFLAAATAAAAQTSPLPYPDIVDATHASPEAAAFFRQFFTAKSLHHPDDMMALIARNDVLYIDATSGGLWPSWDSLNAVFQNFRSKPSTALSYPLRIYGDARSALVSFADTPELFGRELRILGAVTFDNGGRIIRWMDYWDGRSSNVRNTLKPSYPTDFHDTVGAASPGLTAAAQALQTAFATGDAATAAALFAPDAVYEDMALHTQILGRLAIGRYLARSLAKLPYGTGAALVHTVGSDQGGGYEWRPAPDAPMRRGITALALDGQGRILTLTTVYDSSLIPDETYKALVGLGAEQGAN